MSDETLYRPIKRAISLRVDSDVLAWFKSLEGKYQSNINWVLRKYMMEQQEIPGIPTAHESSTNPLFLEDSSKSSPSEGIIKTFPKNTIVISEGDESHSVYFIHSGKVKVFVSDESGREVIIDILGPGEYFGELGVIKGEPQSFSVQTLNRSEISTISRSKFLLDLAENTGNVRDLILALVERNLALVEIVRNLALHDVYGRVARTLLKLAHPQDGRLIVDQRLTHQELANMVGASREMVSRILKDLHTGGYIEIKNKVITISGKLPRAW